VRVPGGPAINSGRTYAGSTAYGLPEVGPTLVSARWGGRGTSPRLSASWLGRSRS